LKTELDTKHTSEGTLFDNYRIFLGVSEFKALQMKTIDSAIKKSFLEPIASLTIRETSKDLKKVAILVSDYSSPIAIQLILPHVIKELEFAGINKDKIVVIVANGLYGPVQQIDYGKILGMNLNVVAHDPDDKNQLVYLGETSYGMPIVLNREAVSADFCISIGTIQPHPIYGWSGGAESVFPGIASRETIYIQQNRFQYSIFNKEKFEENLNLKEMEEIGRLIGLKYICNLVQSEKDLIIGLFSGDPIRAHRAGIQFCRNFCESN